MSGAGPETSEDILTLMGEEITVHVVNHSTAGRPGATPQDLAGVKYSFRIVPVGIRRKSRIRLEC